MQAKDIPDELILRIVNELGGQFSKRDGREDPIDKIDEMRKHSSVRLSADLTDPAAFSVVMPPDEYLSMNLELRWSNTCDIEDSLVVNMGKPIPEKVVAAKLSKLLRRELVTGCNCGCRGDYAVTLKAIDGFDLSTVEVVSRYPRKSTE